MRTAEHLRTLAGITAATLAGAAFFFVIIGVFGLPLAIAGLALFACSAIAIDLIFPTGGTSHEA